MKEWAAKVFSILEQKVTADIILYLCFYVIDYFCFESKLTYFISLSQKNIQELWFLSV